jgi:hypothetical protein
VVPFPVEHTASFTQQSLVPAQEAARSLLHVDPLPTLSLGGGWWVAVGDYPGGGDEPRVVEGPSAGLPLGAALVARAAGLELRRDVYSTARLSSDGGAWALTGETPGLAESQLRAKGRIVALIALSSHREVQPLVITAGEKDGRFIAAGASEFGVAIAVETVQSLPVSTDRLITNIYGGVVANEDRDLARVREQAQIRPRASATAWSRVGQHLAQRILDAPGVGRWVFMVPQPPCVWETADRQLSCEQAVGMALARQSPEGGQRQMVPLYLSADQLYDELFLAHRSVSQVVALRGRVPLPREEGQRLARLAIVEADLRHGKVVLFLGRLADGDRQAVDRLLGHLDSRVRRIVTAKWLDAEGASYPARSIMLKKYGFVEERFGEAWD